MLGCLSFVGLIGVQLVKTLSSRKLAGGYLVSLRLTFLLLMGRCCMMQLRLSMPLLVAWDGWNWRELKTLPVCWFDGLAAILRLTEETGVLA